MYAYSLISSSTKEDLSTYQYAVSYLKNNYDIDLLIEIIKTRTTLDYTGLLSTMITLNSTEYDIFQVDTATPGQYADYFLDLGPYIPDSLRNLHSPTIYGDGNVQGKQVAVPLFADYGVLYFRSDLLEKYGFNAPPTSLDEMEMMMETIVPGEQAQNPSFVGYIGQFSGWILGNLKI
ncbi:hypothetical protein HDU97_002999 [Phlyctochytrium planicorne]|nr:hypothetical protein HDU97_002999 [Phlyctochytrium planicorne]